jgi:2-polyprenyl-6-methoxyphenol hydroxylase-like FAD-dependent oxidoreductase
MLLAQRGFRVLLVDRASFPSDTISTHLVHPPGIASLQRWGLLDELLATGCPPLRRYRFDFGFAVLDGTPPGCDGAATAYAPRRTVLDAILVEAARGAGVDVRERYIVEEVLTKDGRVVGIRGRAGGASSSQVDRAPLVVGADGRHSLMARTMNVPAYKERPPTTAGYYTYFAGLTLEDYRVWVREDRAVVITPTHDDLHMVLVGWPRAQYAANKTDVAGNYRRALQAIPEIADSFSTATAVQRIVGTGDMVNAFRRPFGPGFALVGDAGYVKDPCTAQGITDAFRDSELLADAATAWFGGASFDVAMAGYHRSRDKSVRAMYDLTGQFASLKPMPAFMRAVFRAMQTDQAAMDRFAGVMAGTVPVRSVFNPLNFAGLLLRAHTRKSTHADAEQPVIARPV